MSFDSVRRQITGLKNLLLMVAAYTVTALLVPHAHSDTFSSQAVKASHAFLSIQADILTHRYKASHYTISIEPPPKRIKLPRCPEHPDVTLISDLAPGKQSLKITCHSHDNNYLLMHAYIGIFVSRSGLHNDYSSW